LRIHSEDEKGGGVGRNGQRERMMI